MHGQERLFTITLLLLFLGGNPANATVGFHPPVSYPVEPAPVAVVIGDFNGDGKPDLAVANHGDPSAGDDGNLSILLGNGDGTFQAAKTVAAGKNPASLVVADFDGDNRLDLAVVNSNDSLTLLLGKGDGTFQAPVAYATAPSPIALKVGDVNGDQRPDLIVLQGDPGLAIRGIVGIFLGNGDGSFQSRVDKPTGSYVHSLATFDVNNDQKLDLLMGAGIDGIETMLGNGDGTFLPGLYCRCGAQNGVSDSVSIRSVTGGRDFNGDGRMDFAAEYSEGRLSNNKLSFFLKEMVLLVNADGTFTPIDVGIDIPVKIDYSDPPRIFAEIADFDHDGRTDLALAMPTGLSVLFGNGDGSFQSVHFNSGPANATSIVAADLNGDGFPDLIMTNGFGNTVSVMLSTTQPLPILSIPLAGNGSGTVSFGNFLCPDVVCSAPFDPGTEVSLTAGPAANSTFAGWGAACSGTGSCDLIINSDQAVTATFVTPEFSMSASAAAPNPISPGQSSSASVDIGAVNGFNSSVSLVCSVQPAPAQKPQCSVSPASIAPGSTATLTVTTSAPTVALISPSTRSSLFYAMWLPVFGLTVTGIGINSRRNRKAKWLGFLLCSLLFAGLLLQVACGGGSTTGGGSPGTPKGQYTIAITGTSGSLQHSTNVVLTVQ